ncbi:flagellar biosynthesis protein [Roseivivax halodurans JCM 10272]|uniref:Flagellar hook-basal body complex protein FliE n=1 Tax=Roseivivax halodurans JCM 10272 TaxID=1449350 RepID=X7EK89_9RHOB|nr:flagellar hook-basal body complex protein FliE [Roseivivax halodurans]ETX16295.1 flagellar biosynthesis protein [Roseivivax halodurans JCM 10272]
MAEPLISSSAALGAYRNSQSLEKAAPEPGGGDFAKLLGEATSSGLSQARAAETVMQEGLSGQQSTQAVVEATLQLESTVKMAVSIRDKLVEAYQEIMRMPV